MTPYSVPALYMYIFNYVGNCQLSGVPVQVCPGWPRTAIGVGLDQKLSGFAATHSHSLSGQLSRASLHPEALRPVKCKWSRLLALHVLSQMGVGVLVGRRVVRQGRRGKIGIGITYFIARNLLHFIEPISFSFSVKYSKLQHWSCKRVRVEFQTQQKTKQSRVCEKVPNQRLEDLSRCG